MERCPTNSLEDTRNPPRIKTYGQFLQNYFDGFEMRFTPKDFTSRWVQLQVGIAMWFAISPALFILAIQYSGHSSGTLVNFQRWSKASLPVRAALVIQERRREIENDRISKAIQQSQQGQCTSWDEALQRSLIWQEIWGISPLRLAFVIYDVLPSRDNLQRWGMTKDVACVLCGERKTLRHVLSGCRYALAQSRFTWRHNHVLKNASEAMKTACSGANTRESAPRRRMYFLLEGASQFARNCKPRVNISSIMSTIR